MLSRIAANITPSATVAITAKIAECRRSGIDVIGLNIGEPDFNTPANIGEAAKSAIDSGFTRYTAVSGILEIRKAIAEKLRMDNGLDYSPEQISVGTGAKQSLINGIQALCGEGDEVIIPTPCWVSYIEMVKMAGATPVLVQTYESERFALNLENVKKAITDKTKCVLINTPNNPTGAVYNKEVLRSLGELAVKHDFYVISDEIYEKLIYENKRHVSIASLSEAIKEKSLVINGFSKAYAMTGWRIGYVAGATEIVKAINSIQSHTTSNVNSISQMAAIEALRGSQDSIDNMIQTFDERRKFLFQRLNQIEGVQCAPADGAFYLMPNVSSYYGKSFKGTVIGNSVDMTEFILDQAKVAVVPGDAFQSPENIRVAYSNGIELISEGIDRLEKVLKLLK